MTESTRTPARGRHLARRLMEDLRSGVPERVRGAARALAAHPDAADRDPPLTERAIVDDPDRVKLKHALGAIAWQWNQPSWRHFLRNYGRLPAEYADGVCPDCRTAIDPAATFGEHCPRCGHVWTRTDADGDQREADTGAGTVPSLVQPDGLERSILADAGIASDGAELPPADERARQVLAELREMATDPEKAERYCRSYEREMVDLMAARDDSEQPDAYAEDMEGAQAAWAVAKAWHRHVEEQAQRARTLSVTQGGRLDPESGE